jgi:hypothetical protein
MPSVNPQESREAFLQRCVPVLVREGKSQEQAVAICNSMYDQARDSNKKGSGTVLPSGGSVERVLSI